MALVALIFLLVFPTSIFSNEHSRIFYHIQNGRLSEAIALYDSVKTERNKHDTDLLKQMGLGLLDLGWRQQDAEIQTLSLLGAGIATDDRALYILEEALKSNNPKCQLIALNFLSKYNNDYFVIKPALASDILPVRLEAVFQLASKQHPKAFYHIESLMQKAPAAAMPLFPQLFAMSGDQSSIATLKRLMTHPNLQVRTESVLSAAKFNRDDLLPDIRKLSSHLQAEEQEAACIAFGLLKDENSAQRLTDLSRSQVPIVGLSASASLYQFGREEHAQKISAVALKGDPFAITLLGDIPGAEDTLALLAQHKDLNTRINSGLALLERKDRRCLPIIAEILIADARDLGLSKLQSPGNGLTAWKIIPSLKQNSKNNPLIGELSLNLREKTLRKTVELPEASFIALANLLFDVKQKDLIPLLVQLLENLGTENAINLLKQKREQVGVPFIRCWCNLALYRMGEGEPFTASVKSWVKEHHNHDLIQLRPYLPWNYRDSHYQLTTEDTSRLLVESFEALVQTRDEQGLDLLIEAIRDGNVKNRFALAGLLIRAAN